jgi:ABC-type amino acid transport substrate-binding protein
MKEKHTEMMDQTINEPNAIPDKAARLKNRLTVLAMGALFWMVAAGAGLCGDLNDVLQRGKLRHLGIVYANFVIEDHMGLDVELMQRFAAHLGVDYELVETNWRDVLPDLIGREVVLTGDAVDLTGERTVRGDVIATGFTVLPWREKIVNFSEMTFPTGVWLIARADAAMQPIHPTGNMAHDIEAVKNKLGGVSVLALKNSCLDPDLYNLRATGASVQLFPPERKLDEMIPSVLANLSETTLMDVPVALVALEKWPGKIKVVGPISELQEMACAFAKTSPRLLEAFNDFFRRITGDGTYHKLVAKYYPSLFMYYPDFLKQASGS